MVLGSIDFNKFKPKVILFEDNENFGGSAESINLLLKNGYKHLFSSGGSVAFYSADLLGNNFWCVSMKYRKNNKTHYMNGIYAYYDLKKIPRTWLDYCVNKNVIICLN